MSLFACTLGRMDGWIRGLYSGPGEEPQIRINGDYEPLRAFLRSQPDRRKLAEHFAQTIETQIALDAMITCCVKNGQKAKCHDPVHLRLHRTMDRALEIVRHFAQGGE